MKYVEWESVKGSAKGVDTLENFMSWSKLPAALGKFKIIRRFESETMPEGYKIKPTREQLRTARKAATDAANQAKAKAGAQQPPQVPVVPTVPTPPEGLVLNDLAGSGDEDENIE